MSTPNTPKHSGELSHEIETGHSGPARSYWEFYRKSGPDTRGLRLGGVCLHHTDCKLDVELQASSISYMLDQAFEAGRVYQAACVRESLNYGRRRP